jgi:mRNA interferase MazF
MVLLEQIRTIDKGRLQEYISSLAQNVMEEIDRAIRVSVGLKAVARAQEGIVLRLCPDHAAELIRTPGYILKRVAPLARAGETCLLCHVQPGYDYQITAAQKDRGTVIRPDIPDID